MRKKTEYQKLLLDPRWQKRRLDILNRDGFTCRECGATDRTLHVHHMLYRRALAPWEYDDGALITLCEDCHAQEHETRRESEAAVLDELRSIGVTASSIEFLSHCLAMSRANGGGEARELFFSVLDALSLCSTHPDAKIEFLEFCKNLKKHRRPFGEKAG